MEKEILVANEVAKWLRVKPPRVYDLAREGKIPVILIGSRQYRFSATAVKRWLESGGNVNGGEDNAER